MVTNIAGLQMKNNVNVINEFSKLVNCGHTGDVPVLQKWT